MSPFQSIKCRLILFYLCLSLITITIITGAALSMKMSIKKNVGPPTEDFKTASIKLKKSTPFLEMTATEPAIPLQTEVIELKPSLTKGPEKASPPVEIEIIELPSFTKEPEKASPPVEIEIIELEPSFTKEPEKASPPVEIEIIELEPSSTKEPEKASPPVEIEIIYLHSPILA